MVLMTIFDDDNDYDDNDNGDNNNNDDNNNDNETITITMMMMTTMTMLKMSNMNRVIKKRHTERYGVLNHRRLECLLNRLSRRRSKKTSKLRVTGLCEGNLPGTGELPA